MSITFFGDNPIARKEPVHGPQGEVLYHRSKLDPGCRIGDDGLYSNAEGALGQVMGEEFDRDRGTTTQTVRVPKESGVGWETHEIEWQRTGERQMTIARTRRVHS